MEIQQQNPAHPELNLNQQFMDLAEQTVAERMLKKFYQQRENLGNKL